MHDAGDLSGSRGCHQQVDVVGHQHVRMHGTAFAQRDFAQVLQVAHPVDVSKEARLAIIAALDDMLRDLGEVESWLARHESVLAVTPQA